MSVALTLAVAAGLAPGSTAAEAQESAAMARLEFRPAPFELPPDVRDSVRFGWLTVPYDHGDPRAGTLRLAVAIIAPRTGRPEPDPIVLIPGGPGDAHVATSTVAVARSPRVGLHRLHRTVILLDPRGHGLSEPHVCPELSGVVPPAAADSTGETIFMGRLAECRRVVEARGVRLDLLSSVQSAGDLDSLRSALGVAQLNLVGASYGSHIASITARDVPHRVRAAVLHGPVPPGGVAPGVGTDDVIKALLRRCSEQPDCRRAYPALDADVKRVLGLAAQDVFLLPLNGGGAVVVDSAMIHAHLGELMYGRDLIAGAPALIHHLAGAGMAGLESLIPLMMRRLVNPALSYGTHLAFRCNDGTADSTLVERCRTWIGDAPAAHWTTTSVVRALVVTGEFDARTPPHVIPQVTQNFIHAQGFVTPWYGHEGLPDCAFRMADAFIIAPDRVVNDACLDSIPPVRFAVDVRSTRWMSRVVMAATQWKAAAGGLVAVGVLLCIVMLSALAAVRLRRAPASPAQGAADLAALVAALAGVAFVVAITGAAYAGARESPLLLAIGPPSGFHWVSQLPVVLALVITAAIVLHLRARSDGPTGRLRILAITGAAVLFGGCVVLSLS